MHAALPSFDENQSLTAGSRRGCMSASIEPTCLAVQFDWIWDPFLFFGVVEFFPFFSWDDLRRPI